MSVNIKQLQSDYDNIPASFVEIIAKTKVPFLIFPILNNTEDCSELCEQAVICVRVTDPITENCLYVTSHGGVIWWVRPVNRDLTWPLEESIFVKNSKPILAEIIVASFRAYRHEQRQNILGMSD